MARSGPGSSRQASASPSAPFSASSNQTKPNSTASSAQQSSADPSGKKSWKDVLKAPAKPILNAQTNGTDQQNADPARPPAENDMTKGKGSAALQDSKSSVVGAEVSSLSTPAEPLAVNPVLAAALEVPMQPQIAPQQQEKPANRQDAARPMQPQQGQQAALQPEMQPQQPQQRHAEQQEHSPSRPVGSNEMASAGQPAGPAGAPPNMPVASMNGPAGGGFGPMVMQEGGGGALLKQPDHGGGVQLGLAAPLVGGEGKEEAADGELQEGMNGMTLNAGAAEFSPVGPTPPFGRPMMPGAPMPYEMMAYYAQMQNPQFYGAFAYPQMEGKGPLEMQMGEGMGEGMPTPGGGMEGGAGPMANGAHGAAPMVAPGMEGAAQGGPMPGAMPPYYGYVYPYGPNAGMYGPGGGFMGGPAPPDFFPGMPAMMEGGMPVMGGMNGGMPPGMGVKRDGARGGDRRGHGGRGGGGMRGLDMRGHPHDMGSGQDGPEGMGPMGRRMAGPMGHMGDGGRGMDGMGPRGMGGRGMVGPGDKYGSKGGAHGRGMGQQEEQEELYSLNPLRVERGEDKRTTVMVKNIPNKYTQKNLLDLIDSNHQGLYDFFYLPIDFKNKCNLGYAFINFRDPRCISAFFRDFADKRWERFNSEKVCVVTYARIQGKAALVNHFRSSRLMLKHEKYRPLIFSESGKVETIPPSNSRSPGGAGVGGRPMPVPPGARGPMMGGHQGPHGRGMGMGGVGPVGGGGGMRGAQMMQVVMPEAIGAMGAMGMGMPMGMGMGAAGPGAMAMGMPGALPSPSMLQAAPGLGPEEPRRAEQAENPAGQQPPPPLPSESQPQPQPQSQQQNQQMEGMAMGGQLPQIGMAQA